MKRILSLALAGAIAFSAAAWKHNFRTVDGDPMNSLLYTLPNGLKVFMTVNKEQPRIQTYIAVRVGGKNDPAETTGLAHYFEHLMFKGTEQFGTSDYAAEKPMLDQIEQLFETYRHTADSTERAQIYHKIDSISYQASLIAIPNEYDKLMATIGANGTNAYTSYDVTCYVEDIPSNQIENWALIQADRFKHPVLRGFHTELETIYEEKNMSLTSDPRKSYEALWSLLYPHHPYGTQTVLGTQENLKNPSITNVKNYHAKWYVPNNMAICLSGDFDPDHMVDVIEKYFGDMKPNNNLDPLPLANEAPLTAPLSRTVMGNEAEMFYMAWRLPEAKNPDMLKLSVLGEVLQNGECGIIDLNVTLPQKMLGGGSFAYGMADAGIFVCAGRPKEGQTLDDIRDIFLEQIDKLRKGEFSDDLVPAVVNNLKKQVQQQLGENSSRADYFVEAFVNGQDWADEVAQIAQLDKITKADVVEMANKYFGDNNYATVYKRQGKDENELKMSKPKITPIATNRDMKSDFLAKIQQSPVEPIEPVFVDFDRDLTFLKAKEGAVDVIYTHNPTNDLFSLIFVYEYGRSADKPLAYVNQYLDLIGTPDMSAEQIKAEFYKLACSYYVSAGNDRTYVVLSGLSENMDKALALYEKLVAEAVPDTEVWNELAARFAKGMNDNKSNQAANFSALRSYALYQGAENNPSIQLAYTPDELKALSPKEITDAAKRLGTHKHRVIYYGPMTGEQLVASLDAHHRTPATLADAPKGRKFEKPVTDEAIIFVAPYDAKQLYMALTSNRGEKFNPDTDAMRQYYNEYFGGGMNSIVFQEMRESRSLAYSAGATMSRPSRLDEPMIYGAFIATQNDKMGDAIDAFDDIINNMPMSESAFQLAKEGLDSRMRSERTIKDNIAWAYINAQDLGLDYDQRQRVFEGLTNLKLSDIQDYQLKNVKDRKYVYAILGNVEDLDLDKLRSLGRVVVLKTSDIFGF